MGNRLVVTNNHVVRNAKEVRVYFSAYDEKGELITDSRVYEKNFEALKAARIAMVGRVVARWKDKDLALVQLPQLPAEAQALPLAAESAQPGETVHSIGSSGANDACLWRYTRGFVRNSYRCPNRKIFYLETDSATNSGDSGGPMVNDNGEIVGIVVSQDTRLRLVSQAIELRELRSLLEWYAADASDDAADEGALAGQ
jgi:S1-C subfamily serine protease